MIAARGSIKQRDFVRWEKRRKNREVLFMTQVEIFAKVRLSSKNILTTFITPFLAFPLSSSLSRIPLGSMFIVMAFFSYFQICWHSSAVTTSKEVKIFPIISWRQANPKDCSNLTLPKKRCMKIDHLNFRWILSFSLCAHLFTHITHVCRTLTS